MFVAVVALLAEFSANSENSPCQTEDSIAYRRRLRQLLLTTLIRHVAVLVEEHAGFVDIAAEKG